MLNRRSFLTAVGMAVPTVVSRRVTRVDADRLGASTACLAGMSLLDALAQLRTLGFATVELIMYTGARHSVGDIPGFAFDRAGASERAAVLERTRAFRHISGHLPFQDVNLFAGTAEDRQAGLARIRSALDGLAYLKGEVGVMHIGRPPAGRTYRDIWPQMIGLLHSLGDDAEQRGLSIAVETMQPDSVRDYSELFEAVDHPRIGAAIDTGHIRGSSDIGLPAGKRNTPEARARFNDVLNDLVVRVGRKVTHVHLSDVRAGDWTDHQALGSGIIDFPRVFSSLRRIGYQGLLVMELEEPEKLAALERSKSHVAPLVE